jgi:hypothetical protein
MQTAFDEGGEITPIAEFDYDQVERRLTSDLSNPELKEELDRMTPEEREAALKLFRCLVRWLWQDGMKNTDGLTIRSILVCWIFIEELHPMTLTQMARGFGGRHKQSLGRWVELFKQQFPFIRTPHMRFRPSAKTTTASTQ